MTRPVGGVAIWPVLHNSTRAAWIRIVAVRR
jgi:hypothetical protein